jgi:hypothetical protein
MSRALVILSFVSIIFYHNRISAYINLPITNGKYKWNFGGQ